LEQSSVCVVDAAGKIVKEAKVIVALRFWQCSYLDDAPTKDLVA
jgi:hypothetical protein